MGHWCCYVTLLVALCLAIVLVLVMFPALQMIHAISELAQRIAVTLYDGNAHPSEPVQKSTECPRLPAFGTVKPSTARPIKQMCNAQGKDGQSTVSEETKNAALFVLEMAHVLAELATAQGGGVFPVDKYKGWQVVHTETLRYFAAAGPHTVGNEAVYMIVMRGTTSAKELTVNDEALDYLQKHGSTNVRYLLDHRVPMPYPPQGKLSLSDGTTVKANIGFLDTYDGKIRSTLEGLVEDFGKGLSLYLGGHSLGAGVACISAVLFRDKYTPDRKKIHIINAATPKPGDVSFQLFNTSYPFGRLFFSAIISFNLREWLQAPRYSKPGQSHMTSPPDSTSSR